MHWRSRARCLGMDPYIFFPQKDDYDTRKYALSICSECPVSQECLNVCLSHPDGGGIWGGTTERQRKHMRKRRRELKVVAN